MNFLWHLVWQKPVWYPWPWKWIFRPSKCRHITKFQPLPPTPPPPPLPTFPAGSSKCSILQLVFVHAICNRIGQPLAMQSASKSLEQTSGLSSPYQNKGQFRINVCPQTFGSRVRPRALKRCLRVLLQLKMNWHFIDAWHVWCLSDHRQPAADRWKDATIHVSLRALIQMEDNVSVCCELWLDTQ